LKSRNAMDAEIKAQWVSALRETGRRQGTGKLRDGYGAQCCLDVLCELAVKADVIDNPVLMTSLDTYIYVYDDGDSQREEWEVLPEPVMAWAEFEISDPILDGSCLSCWNDDANLSFQEIADLIEGSDL
jgi:hypothetical protein